MKSAPVAIIISRIRSSSRTRYVKARDVRRTEYGPPARGAERGNGAQRAAKAADILTKYTKLSPAIVRASVRAKFGLSLSPEQIEPTIDLAVHDKLLDEFPAANLI